jgi:uncharacterized protein YdaU (DUF1376 family)
VHYYTHHIGDYKRDTAHLTLTEHGVYRQLLDLYYLTENPLDANALRLIGARTSDEQELANTILNEFFENTPDGYVHKRCEVEINRIYEKSEKARASAKARWNKPDNANAMRTQCEDDANGMLPINPIPINPDKYIVANDVSSCPQKEIVNLYREILPMGIQPLTWDGGRADLLRARWRENKKRQNLDWWRGFFEHIKKSPFLTGQTSSIDRKPFTIALDWIVKAENFRKITEGKYHA